MTNHLLTQQEQSCLTTAWEFENLCINKCSLYAEQCQDHAVKSLLWDITRNKRQHANEVKQLLQQLSTTNSFN